MRSLEDPLEELAFYNHDSNRAVAVVWPAIVENRLTDALRVFLRPDESVAKELFRPEGALGTFGQKVKLAYMLGLYEKDLKDDLVLLTKIRNAFAHRVDITTFETSPIRDYMDQMNVLRIHRELLDRLNKDNSPERRTERFVLRNELSDYRNSFHLCIRFMIHALVAIERKPKTKTEMASRSTLDPASPSGGV